MRKVIFTLFGLLIFTALLHSQVRIKMKKESGIYTIPCVVNGLRLRFIFDTGASNVSLSLTEASFMLRNGYLEEADIHGSSYSQIANGDIIKNTTVTLKEINIGGLFLYNIEAIIIHELSAPLLLGQSAIQQLGRIQLEGDELVIMDKDEPSSKNSCSRAENLIKKAIKYNKEKLFDIAAITFQEAYDLCPSSMSCLQIDILGKAYYQSKNYSLAIKYLKKNSGCYDTKDVFQKIFMQINYFYTALSYEEMGNYNEAIIYYQRAISLAEGNELISSLYGLLGAAYYNNKEYSEALNNYKLGLDYYFKGSSVTTNDIITGKVKDKLLGEKYWNIASCYMFLDLETKAESYMIKAALCGDETAISYCKKVSIKYDMFIE